MSEKLGGFEGLFGNLVFPQLVNTKPTNKQLIDAAILRGSLELLKPKQPGENLASQASRGLQAAAKFGDDIMTQRDASLVNQLKMLKLQKEMNDGTQLSLSMPELKGLTQVVKNTIRANPALTEKLEEFATKIDDTFKFPGTDINPETYISIATEVGILQNIHKNKSGPELTNMALDNLLGNKPTSNVKPKDPNKPDLSSIGG
tara:strand:- start:3071 stop:3679 length:609 start_codon:yes stop_codon:yes gene_type:complete